MNPGSYITTALCAFLILAIILSTANTVGESSVSMGYNASGENPSHTAHGLNNTLLGDTPADLAEMMIPLMWIVCAIIGGVGAIVLKRG